MSRSPLGGYLPVEVEMLAEMAATLRHTARTLEAMLAKLDRLREAGASEAEYRRLRLEAERQRWHLVVQREAIGFTRSDDIYEAYPLPPPWEAVAPAAVVVEEEPAPAPAVLDLGGSRCPSCAGPLPLHAGPATCAACGLELELRVDQIGAGPYRALETVRVVKVLPAPGFGARLFATLCVILSSLRMR